MCPKSRSISPTKRMTSGTVPRKSCPRSACRRPSGPSPGQAARVWRATYSITPRLLPASACSNFASGSGLVAIAAMKAGAANLTGADIDPFCETAIRLNAEANAVEVGFLGADQVGRDDGWDVVLAGDVFYEKPFADRLVPWFEALRSRGADVLVGDPGRSYLPKDRLQKLATYEVPVTRALEDAEVKRTTVWRFA
ncbi:truncated 50S ribosomal protein L11 methyltransferase [Aminobacter sp. Y103A]|nr:truncated 50S ribosomal protein L11 methyltransferase [Aminobacter sp. SS-2016]